MFSVFNALVNELYGTDWVVYSKAPFGGVQEVYAYLGRYPHPVRAEQQPLLAIDDQHVRFVGRRRKLVTLTHDELQHRLLQHVLPRDFVTLRHYGLLAPCNATTVLEVARVHLGEPTPAPAVDDSTPPSIFSTTLASPGSWTVVLAAARIHVGGFRWKHTPEQTDAVIEAHQLGLASVLDPAGHCRQVADPCGTTRLPTETKRRRRLLLSVGRLHLVSRT